MSFFSRNIGRTGRILRAIAGLGLLVMAVVIGSGAHRWWVGLILGISGCFGLFEAFRGWCFLRACGIKTKF